MKIGSVIDLSTDVLVIGAGGAGLRAAIEARKHGASVIVACKSRAGLGNCTSISKAGFAAAANRKGGDSPEIHYNDTIRGGCFLGNRDIVCTVTNGALSQALDLESYGVNLDRQGNTLSLLRVPGHTNPRQVHCRQGLGTAITLPMTAYANNAGVKFLEHVLITRLLLSGGMVAGAAGISRAGNFITIKAGATIIAAGGLGQIYRNTNNTAGTTGDGYALAYEAGAALSDMEFIQFYPTAIGSRGAKLMLYEILVYREGGSIINSLGEDVLAKHNLSNSPSATRDKVSRALMREILEGKAVEGKLTMDISSISRERRNSLQDIVGDRSITSVTSFRVAPTVHYAMGGIKSDAEAGTGIPGLFAAGETCSGMHGANRLGGNAISEILVMGAIAGKNAAREAAKKKTLADISVAAAAEKAKIASCLADTGGQSVREARERLKTTMWLNAGIIRKEETLTRALAEVRSLEADSHHLTAKEPDELWQALEFKNMLTVSQMVCSAALERKESRGAHYREDFPVEDNDRWLKNIVISKENGVMSLKLIPAASGGIQ